MAQEQTVEDCKQTLHERLEWELAERDDAVVAQALARGEEMDGVYSLEEAGLLDGFFHWLEEIGVLERLQQVEMAGVKRVLYVGFQLVLLYFLKVLLGIESMNSLPELLFSCGSAMTLVGFNARQVREGLTRRGDDKRKEKRKQGPVSPQTLATYLCKIPIQVLEDCFNGCILCLALAGLFPPLVGVILDASDIETTAKYEGCGKTKRDEWFQDKEGHWRVRERVLFGWKVLVVLEAFTRLPIAVKVVLIQEWEGNYTLEMLDLAQANLGACSRIVKGVIDRGFLDGETLYQLDQRGLIFVIPAKGNMSVAADARGLAFGGYGAVQERTQEVSRGHGRTGWVERLRTRVVGLSELTTYDEYGPEGAAAQRNRKDYEGRPLNAIVVLEWENQVYEREKAPVFLTNAPVEDPWVAFDDYDDRSLIENVTFREGKQGWHLEHAPQKNERGVTVHVLFTLLVMALTTGYRLWCRRQVEAEAGEEAVAEAEAQGILLEPVGIRALRRRLRRENREKVIIFWEGKYGIFHLIEVWLLLGARVKDIPPEIESREAVWRKYGIVRE